MGNPEFAVPSLNALIGSEHEVTAVVTSPDKMVGRGRVLSPMPVAQRAAELDLKLIQPLTLSDSDFIASISAIDADLFVVVAFKILPKAILELPRLGSINLHPSMLPAYRGPAPLQRAIMNGEVETALSTFFISTAVDSGDLLLSRPLVIFPEDDYGSLSARAAKAGAELLIRTVDQIGSGEATPVPQDHSRVTQAPKILPADCKIDWSRTNMEVRNQICALSPSPGAVTTLKGRQFKLLKVALSMNSERDPGEVTAVSKSSFIIRCGSGSLLIEDLQPEGKKRMTAGQFLAGTKLTVGARFE
ncbi:MAG: methionyl-tRNA formyltransferase [Candidatus Marinimicrobia bacterium]|mgnify:CR=1 FL=1|nr:methionyl-tRNA formyltransferase [Candidatus Neomarinimicrobiota bacterium]|tara:strand:+ start:1606 stop:2514 length:909 start_codon:yes stop_codon:yes gene_type:complete